MNNSTINHIGIGLRKIKEQNAKAYVDIVNNTSNERAGAIYNAGTFTAKYVNFGKTTAGGKQYSNTSNIIKIIFLIEI